VQKAKRRREDAKDELLEARDRSTEALEKEVEAGLVYAMADRQYKNLKAKNDRRIKKVQLLQQQDAKEEEAGEDEDKETNARLRARRA
jgi:hypothetical protein